jgi:hypothetical protein
MDFKFFYKSLLRIIFTPGKAWDIVLMENRPIKVLRNNFLFPLIVIVSISAFLGSIIFANKTLQPVYSVMIGIKFFLLLFVVPFIAAFILNEITKPLDLGKDFRTSFRLIVYSMTPFFFCQIASHLFESLIFVNILALYGMYIFWAGAEKILNPPDYKKMPLMISTFIAITGIYIASDLVLSSIVDRIYNSFFV